MSVTSSIDDGVAVLTLNSATGLHVADVATMTELHDTLLQLSTDRHARAIVLTGAGDRAFCAGADITYMSTIGEAEGHAWAELGQKTTHLLETMPQGTIAAVNGLALGGGCELALACDFRLASPAARFGQPEINFGIFPGWGGTQRLARTTNLGFAKELVLTGRLVEAEEALARGLVNAIVDPVVDHALRAAKTIASKSRSSLATAKALCNQALQGDVASSLRREGQELGAILAGPDAREGLTAFLEKRPPRFANGD